MKSVGKARNNGLYRHIRTSKEIIRNLLNDYIKIIVVVPFIGYDSKWPDQSKHRLKKLIQNANDSIVISHSADVSSYKKEIIIWSIMQSTLSVCLIIRKSCAQVQHRQSTMPCIREK